MLKNPATGGTHWFHGTPNTFGSFRSVDDNGHDNQSHPAWNSGIGHHFTSLHEVANQFITDGSGEHNPNGWHIHAKLGIENPKHYDSEHDMLHHAAQVVDPENEHQRVFHHKGEVHNLPVSDDGSGPLSTETHLKVRPKSAQRFREHLIRSGHDGITYGNEFEGPKGHVCAIVFHRDQIKEADRHAGHAPDLPSEHIAKKKRHDNSHHVKHKHRVSHSPGWPGYHPWCTGFYFGGGYIGHDGSCPAHDGGASAPADADDGGGTGSVGGGGDGGGSMGSHRHVATVLTDWKPTQRLFSPTEETVDPRLFGLEDRMRPEVRKAILDSIDNQWKQYGDWRGWARVYLAGSEASKWYGNNDFDILVGINYDAFRAAHSKYAGISDKDLTDAFNRGFSATYNNEDWHPPFDPEDTWHRTGYCNLHSYDITAIKPYAAYDVGNDQWVVTPPDEPQGHQFDPSAYYYAEGVAEQIKNVMRMHEPERSQQAKRLWSFLHEDRSRAFGPNGTGAYDRGNMVEKYLDQLGLWEQLVSLRFGKTASADGIWRPSPEFKSHWCGGSWARTNTRGDGMRNCPECKQRVSARYGLIRAHTPGRGYSLPSGDTHPIISYHPDSPLRDKKGSIPQEDGYDDEYGTHLGGKGKARHRAPVGGEGDQGQSGNAAQSVDQGNGSQSASGSEEGSPGVEADAPRTWHPKVKKDLTKLDGPSEEKVQRVIDTIAAEGRHPSTEPFQAVKGWHKSKAARGIIIVHQHRNGIAHIGYVGNQHNYDEAARRLGSKDPLDYSQCVSHKDDPSLCLWHGTDHLTNQGEPNPNVDGNLKPHSGFDVPRCDLCDGMHDTLHHYDSEHRNAEDDIDHGHALKGMPMEGSKTASEWESENDLKKRMDANHALNEHLALKHPTLVNSGKSHAVMDMYHRIAHGTVGPQQQLPLEGEGWHHHDDLIDPSKPFSVRHKSAAVRTVTEGPKGETPDGIMIAIVPPRRIIEDLVLEEGESAENLHITLAYLGDVADHSEAQLDMLPELVEAWAEGHAKLDARVQGAGTFVNEGSHVLWAAADIPGVNEMHVSLVQYLKGHGFDPKQNHGFTPHITLAYGKSHFRFLPKIAPTEWKVREVWCCVAGRWESFPLRG